MEKVEINVVEENVGSFITCLNALQSQFNLVERRKEGKVVVFILSYQNPEDLFYLGQTFGTHVTYKKIK